ncbi:MAG TPA: hypothetical protein PK926_02660 [Spirochaetota bacterium]|nr:hypothetical protein [Spirochaetota bacterium]HPI88019.1 hypothetical protein [Spirochaetota bacterium]
MKNTVRIMVFILTITIMAASSCTDDSGSEITGGKEYLLNGSWWVSAMGTGEGYYFDGAGGGFDLSLDGSSQVYIVCDNVITYSYDGYNLNVIEHGTSRSFTFEKTGDTTAAITFMGYSFTAQFQELTAECVE